MMAYGAAAGFVTARGLPVRAQPKSGGTLRLGLDGGQASDSWDSRGHTGSFMLVAGMGCVFDCLTEVAADGTLRGELAESWEATADALVWTVNLRRNVTFHNGKPFGADDVLESLALHVGESVRSPATPIISAVAEMKKLNDHQVQFALNAGNADFPHLLSDPRLLIYPAGEIETAMTAGIGTGLYRAESFEPGVRAILSRNPDSYKSEGGFFDAVEIVGITDPAARMNAVMTDQVDVIDAVDFKTEALLQRNPNVAVFEVTGNRHYTFPMHTDAAPFDDNNVRLALKHGINRQELVDRILRGHGQVGNDHPIGPANPYVATELAQRDYDPDRARFHLHEAGLDSLEITLATSEAAFAGAVEAARLYQTAASAAGITIDVVQEPADSYWSTTWLKRPFCAGYWFGRPTADGMFSTAYAAGVPWNETRWDHPRFNMLLAEARPELNPERRREIYAEMQAITRDEGGAVIPMFANFVDAATTRLARPEVIGNSFQLDGCRIAERWSFA